MSLIIKGPTIDSRFLKYDRDHPFILEFIIKDSLEMKRQGRKKGNIDFIFHRLRLHYHKETSGQLFPVEMKLTDTFTSRYARLAMQTEPRLRGFFRLKPLRTP